MVPEHFLNGNIGFDLSVHLRHNHHENEKTHFPVLFLPPQFCTSVNVMKEHLKSCLNFQQKKLYVKFGNNFQPTFFNKAVLTVPVKGAGIYLDFFCLGFLFI